MFSKPIFKQCIRSHGKIWVVFTFIMCLILTICSWSFDPGAFGAVADAVQGTAFADAAKNFTSFLGSLESYYKMIAVLLGMVYVIITSTNLVVDEVDSGSMAYTLSTPVKRSSVVVTKMIYMVGSVVLMFVIQAGVGIGAAELFQHCVSDTVITDDVKDAADALNRKESYVRDHLYVIKEDANALKAGADAREMDVESYMIYLDKAMLRKSYKAAAEELTDEREDIYKDDDDMDKDDIEITWQELEEDPSLILGSDSAMKEGAAYMDMTVTEYKAFIKDKIAAMEEQEAAALQGAGAVTAAGGAQPAGSGVEKTDRAELTGAAAESGNAAENGSGAEAAGSGDAAENGNGAETAESGSAAENGVEQTDSAGPIDAAAEPGNAAENGNGAEAAEPGNAAETGDEAETAESGSAAENGVEQTDSAELTDAAAESGNGTETAISGTAAGADSVQNGMIFGNTAAPIAAVEEDVDMELMFKTAMEAAAKALGTDTMTLADNMLWMKDQDAMAAAVKATGQSVEVLTAMINESMATAALNEDYSVDFDMETYIWLNVGCCLLILAFSAIGFFASCLFNRSKNAMAVGGGIPFASFIISIIVEMSDNLENLKYITLTTLFDTQEILALGDFGAGLWVLAGISAVLYAAGCVIFTQKDLPL